MRTPRQILSNLLLTGALASIGVATALAQLQPVATMFSDDQKRGETIALSFSTSEIPASTPGGTPLQLYLTAGDLERAFDTPAFRPDAAVVPTNTDLAITAPSPPTQRILTDRLRKQPAVMRDLQDQIAERKKKSPGSADGVLAVGADWFMARLPAKGEKPPAGAFPKAVCLVATDFAKGGSIDRRELFTQDRVRKGIAGCLTALDGSGAQSLVLPLMGAASAGTQSKDPAFEGQRILKECRLLNSVAGIALGIHDYLPTRRNLKEIGVIQYDQELVEMFSLPKGTRIAQTAQNIYRTYADQVKMAFRKGLDGEKTTAADVDGNCNAIFSN